MKKKKLTKTEKLQSENNYLFKRVAFLENKLYGKHTEDEILKFIRKFNGENR